MGFFDFNSLIIPYLYQLGSTVLNKIKLRIHVKLKYYHIQWTKRNEENFNDISPTDVTVLKCFPAVSNNVLPDSDNIWDLCFQLITLSL